MSESSSRNYFADYIRVFATMAVILLHCSGDLLYSFGTSDFKFSYWWAGNIYDSATRWCVPVFVMLSGALLLRPAKQEDIGFFLSRRMMRVMIPYLFWCVIYLLYTYRGNIRDWREPYWAEMRDLVFFKEVYYHLWFVPMILGLYLLTPIYRVFVRHATRFEVEYFLTVWFAVNIIGEHFPGFFITRYIGWLAYSGYFLMGNYLMTYTLTKSTRRWIYILGIIGLLITTLGTWQMSAWFGKFSDRLYLYLCANVMATALAVFVWFLYYDWAGFAARNPRFHQFVKYLSSISFGVYLIHVLLMDCFKNAYFWGIKIHTAEFMNHAVHPFVAVPLFFVTIFILSIILISILKKIPFINKIIL